MAGGPTLAAGMGRPSAPACDARAQRNRPAWQLFAHTAPHRAWSTCVKVESRGRCYRRVILASLGASLFFQSLAVSPIVALIAAPVPVALASCANAAKHWCSE